MSTQKTEKTLIEFGKFLSQYGPEKITKKNNIKNNDPYFEVVKSLVNNLHHSNPWFTPDNVRLALSNWVEALSTEKIKKWLSSYNVPDNTKPKNVGIIMAGNIPLVGLHDLLSVLTSGHRAVVKMSSSDNKLLPVLVKYLENIHPDWKGKVEFKEEGRFNNIDAVIATGSDNSARYFEYYFGKWPHIIRKNRNGVAVLTGDENEKELEGLADDIFTYFGLGCRNVSKIFVPKDFDLNKLFKASLKYSHYTNHEKYMNNYRFNKAVLSMDKSLNENKGVWENGLLILKRDPGYSAPVSVVFYEDYENVDNIKKILNHDQDKIQVIVSQADIPGAIPYGTTQKPELWDYADGVDTMAFLLDLHNKN